MRKRKKIRRHTITVTREVHTILHAIARSTRETPNAIIARSLLPKTTKGGVVTIK